MIEVLNALGIEFVVLGNHEFDFGAPLLKNLLTDAQFTTFGSNVRDTVTRDLFPGLVDYQVLPLPNGLRLGIFGVCTTVTGKDPFAGTEVVFENEVMHARRCVEVLKDLGVDVIVALTHLKVAEDQALVAHVAGIDLVLGGHDHEPMSLFVNNTMIHKSGQDALWMGHVELTITKTEETYDRSSSVDVGFQWQMLCNRGHEPEPACQEILLKYAAHLEQELRSQGKLEPLATSRTLLDGSRLTCRTRESNFGNLITDALREELQVDIAILNAGFIKGDDMLDADSAITMHWLEKVLPLRKPSVVIEMSEENVRSALTQMLRKYPNLSSSFPQISGFHAVFDFTERKLVSFSLDGEPREKEKTTPQRMLRVATAMVPSMDGWEVFAAGAFSPTGPLVRDLVASFVTKKKEIMYPSCENRLSILE
jgi:5'-nucleotidase